MDENPYKSPESDPGDQGQRRPFASARLPDLVAIFGAATGLAISNAIVNGGDPIYFGADGATRGLIVMVSCTTAGLLLGWIIGRMARRIF